MERDGGEKDKERSGDSGSGGGKRRYGAADGADEADDVDRCADRGERRSERDEHNDAEERQDTKKKVKRKRRSGEHGASPDAGRLSRKDAVPHIKRWLREHVVEREEGSLLKRELFEDYLRFCMQSNLNPTNDATFGRMVNAVFPNVQQRRLRRDSHIKKWHYCGIAHRSGGGARSPPISATIHTATSVVGSPFAPTTTTTSTTPTSAGSSLSAFSWASIYHPALPHLNYHPPHNHPPPAYSHGNPPPPPQYHSSLGPPPLYTPFYPDQAFQAPSQSSPTRGAPLPAYAPSAPNHHPPPSYSGRFHSHLLPVPAPLDEAVPPHHHPSAQPPLLPAASQPFGGLPSGTRLYSNSYSPDESGPGKGKALTDRHAIGNRLIASTSASPPSMWLRNVDNSLPFLHQLQFYASFYRREIWGFEPLNPLCMKADTLRYLFATEEGSKERSPLSLCTHYALCAGALLSGHVAQAKEHLAAAREHLGYVFDSSDYDVACALCYITFVTRFFAQNEREGKELSQYYLTLGLETCESIGALNDDLYTMLVKSCAIYLHRIEEEASTLLRAESVPRWRKPWKQGKYYVEQYKYGKVVSALQEYTVDTLKQLVVLLLRPPHQPPTPEEWWTLREACAWREGAITGLEQLYLFAPPRQLTTFLRAYVIFARAVCNLRVNFVDDTRQASSDFLLLLSGCNRGVVARVFSDLWWTGACAEAFVDLVVFLHRDRRRDLVTLALTLLDLVKSDLTWADEMHGRLVALVVVPNSTDGGDGGGVVPIKQEKEWQRRDDDVQDFNGLGYLGDHKPKATVEEDGAQRIGTSHDQAQQK